MTDTTLASVVTQIWKDYENNEGPFGEIPVRETTSTADIDTDGPADAARFVTFTATVDYQKSARFLWRQAKEFWETEPWIFDPAELVSTQKRDALESLFREHGFRFYSQDATWWYRNAEVFYREFDSEPLNLFKQQEYDAKRIHRFAKARDDIYALGGQKVGGHWLRAVHEEVHTLHRIDQIPIPVDVQVVRVTNKLTETYRNQTFTEEQSEAIQQFWEDLCREHDLPAPIRLDKALWAIGDMWDDGGKEYVGRLVESPS